MEQSAQQTQTSRWQVWLSNSTLLIIGGIGASLIQGLIFKTITDYLIIGPLIACIFFGFIIVLLVSQSKKLNEICDNLCMKVKYIAIDDKDDFKKAFYEATKIIKQAKSEIYVLNAASEEHPHPEEIHNPAPRQRYFDALIKMSHAVKYTRVLQVDEGSNLPEIFDHSYINHFKKMMREKGKTIRERQPIGLYLVSPQYPSTFVIVDNRYLLWQLNMFTTQEDEKGQPQKKLQMRGLVIIYDPENQFIGEFKLVFLRTFEAVQRQVKPIDLQPTPFKTH